MMAGKHLQAIFLVFLIILSGCSNSTPQVAPVPTATAQREIPTQILPTPTKYTFPPTSTYTPTFTPTFTYTPTFTPKPSSTALPTETSTAVPSDTPIPLFSSTYPCVPSDTERIEAQVVNVVDVNTIEVIIYGVTYSLRYIGINTPENTSQVEYDGNEATNKNKELVDGKVVTLVKDVSDRDRLDHLLRYVFVGDIFVNYELVKQGYANAKAYPPDTACQETFTDAETLARETGLGMWAVSVATATSPAASTGGSNVKITTIFVDGSGQNEPDEYVEIRNDGSQPQQLQGWTLQDKANHVFRFPSFLMEPGQTCRVYTNENHPESCGFSFYNSGSAVWNNSGDCAYLSDSQGNQVDDYCY